jgi:hypothetical protein
MASVLVALRSLLSLRACNLSWLRIFHVAALRNTRMDVDSDGSVEPPEDEVDVGGGEPKAVPEDVRWKKWRDEVNQVCLRKDMPIGNVTQCEGAFC